MLIIILTTALNVSLYLAMIDGVDGALNIAMVIMWAMAILNVLIMFVSEANLLREPDKHFLFKWTLILLTFGTAFHSIYWGYFWAPLIWIVSASLRLARKYELNNRKRF